MFPLCAPLLLSSLLPSLWKAHESLLAQWGPYMNTTHFNWKLMKNIIATCHLYDKDANYKPFDSVEPKKDFVFEAIRRI